MSEVITRPSGLRGRGVSRGGGRGSFSNRGGRGGGRATNGTLKENTEPTSLEEEGDIGELKIKYAAKIEPIKEMFPDWTEQDIAFALDETNGDLENTVERISEGTISQWGEVKKKSKERSASKAKDPAAAVSNDTSSAGGGRGGRGRGASETTRGGRGRGADRGRGASRGARAAAVAAASANGPRSTKSTSGESSWVAPHPEPAAPVATGNWDTSAAAADSNLESSWENVTAEAVQPTEPAKPASKPDGTRSWASMFAKPKPAPVPPKPSQHIPSHDPSIEISIPATYNQISSDLQGLPPPAVQNETSEIPITPPVADLTPSDVPPSNDELTETNLEQVPDTSAPPPSATAASTTASTLDARNVGTPLGGPQQNQPGGRPPLGGFATSAWKAAGSSGRSASFQRKVLEQQEAVVMPGKHALDRAAVQFGSMGLNGSPEDVDVDSDREDAETRAQPPQHSPVAPRAALPPAPQQQQPFPPHVQAADSLPTPRQAPGLPPVGHSAATQQQDHISPEEQELNAQAAPGPSGYPYNQFSDRFGTQAPPQKPYEPFGQQGSQPSQTDGLTSSSQPGQQSSQGAFTNSNDMSSYYTSDNQRNNFPNNYYGGYNQQSQQQNQETGRTGSAFGTSAQAQTSQYATSGQQQPQGRFGQTNEAQASGNSTPNPSLSGQQAPNQSHHIMGQQQQGQGHAGGQYSGYPGGYGHPFNPGYYSSYQMNQVSNHPYGRERPLFDDVRRYDDQYLTHNPQYGYGGNQAGYGSSPFGGASAKAALYNQGHQGYGQSPYDQHSASPANAGAFGSQLPSSGRESAAAGGLGSYGRSGSAQATDTPYSGSGAGSQSNMPDPFGGRAQAGYQGHNQGLGSGIGQGGNEDSLRGYAGDSKVPGGPSPALGQPGGRPGSTQGQSSSGPGNYSGYPTHMNQGAHGQQGSQYSSGHVHQSGGQNHQGGGYGGYGGAYGQNYYGSSNRGGWGAGASYGH